MPHRSQRRRRSDRVECLYCGPSPSLPQGYDGFGSAHHCLRKGVGVGKFGERRQWQRRLGYPVDPEYRSVCPRLPAIRRNNRARSSSSSDDSDYSPSRRYRGARSNRSRRSIGSRFGRHRSQQRARPGPRSRGRRRTGTNRRSHRSRSRSGYRSGYRSSGSDFSWF